MLCSKLRFKIVQSLTTYDRQQSTKKFYNPYALGLYFQAVERLEKYVTAGYDLRLSLLNCFNGRLLDRMLKVCELPVSTKAECYVGGFRELPELD
jgi:hypothetical protein